MSEFKVTRIVTTSDGGSKFLHMDIPLDITNPLGNLSKKYDVKGVVFRETEGTYDLDWHNAPCKQFIIMVDGSVDITTTDMETRRFNTGDIILVEDTEGKGHRSKNVDGKPRKSMFVQF
ncbi:hypothetical protein K7432_008596 [Basidiobolus ranarum]|uniref:Cupin 2 conserved barrel domain-containing protein n=1 Tax=Basidiobolus ranarum TaxID=34480 RepID=A0ABR2VYB0_9FUNG